MFQSVAGLIKANQLTLLPPGSVHRSLLLFLVRVSDLSCPSPTINFLGRICQKQIGPCNLAPRATEGT